MKKKFFSIILAFSMFFSIIPQGIIASAEDRIWDGIGDVPAMSAASEFSYTFNNGKLTDFTVTPNTDVTTVNTSNFAYMFYLGFPLFTPEMNEETGEPTGNYLQANSFDYEQFNWGWDNVKENADGTILLPMYADAPVISFNQKNQNIYNSSSAGTTVPEYGFSTEGIIRFVINGLGGYEALGYDSLEAAVNDGLSNPDFFTNNGIFADDQGTPYDINTNLANGTEYPLYVVIFANGGSSSENAQLVLNTTMKLGETYTYTFPDDGGEPTQAPSTETYVGDVTVTLTDPVVGAEPSTSGTALGDNAATSATVAWDTTTTSLTTGGKFDANSVYKADVTVTSSDGVAKFKAGNTVTVNGTAITLTADMIASDGLSATVEYTAPETDPLKVTSVTASGSLTKSSYKPGDTFDASGLKAKITYNNGESVSNIDVTNNSYGVFAALATDQQNASSNSNGTSLTLTSPTDVYIVYNPASDNTSSGIDTSTGLVKSAIADQITVANEAITSATVTIDTFPKPGETIPTTANVPSGANYSAAITWQDESGAEISETTFQYDKKYQAVITITPNTSYALQAGNFPVTIQDGTGTNSDISVSDSAATTSGATVSNLWAATTSTPVTIDTANSTLSYDKYDNNNVVIKLNMGTHADSDLSTLTIGGVTFTSSDYTWNSTNKTITITGDKIQSKFTDISSTSADKAIVLAVTGQSNVTGTNVSVVDTTPYITITDPSDGTISGITHTSGTKVALTKNQAYTLTATPTSTAHWTGTNWTVSGMPTGAASSGTKSETYKFTPTGSENITVSVAFTTAASYTLTVTKSGTGTGTVAVTDGGTAVPEISTGSGTYTVYSDTTYTLTATPDSHNKFVTWSNGATGTTATTTVTPTGPVTVDAQFDKKAAATVSPTTQTIRLDDTNQTQVEYTFTANDYPLTDVQIDGASVSHNYDKTTGKVTIAKDACGGAGSGKTVTFVCGMATNPTATLNVIGATTITVTAPTTTFTHGNSFSATGLKIVITEDSTTYTYENGAWTGGNTPTGVQIKWDINGESFTDLSTWVAQTTTMRRDTHHNATVTVSYSGKNATSTNKVTVNQKTLNLTATATSFDKVYDGNALVKANDLSVETFTSQLVPDDIGKVSLDTISGTYQASSLFPAPNADETNARDIKFTATLTGDAASNYKPKVADGSGKITKRPLTITAINNIPDATQNKADTKSGDSNATISASGTDVTLDTTTSGTYAVVGSDNIAITYHYEYADISAKNDSYTGVTVSSIATTNTNYSVSPTTLSNQSGKVAEREIDSISISDPTTKTYNYSDTFDPTGIKVTVKYKHETPAVEYDWNNVPSTITVKWTGGNAVTESDVLNVNSIKTITASDSNGHSAVTNAITVNPLPVIVTVNGTMTKEYDGDTTYDAADNTGNSITYSAAIDTSMTGYKASYGTQFTTDGVTATGATVAFNSKDVPDANAAVVSNGKINNTSGNYQVTSTANNVTSASITAKTVNVTAITNVPEINQGEATLSGSGKTATNNGGGATMTGVVGGETVQITYNWAYSQSTNAAEPDNNVAISSVALDTVANHDANKNYTLGTKPSTGTGAVKARTVNNITVSDLSDKDYTYGEKLALAGLQVQVSYNTGDETYVWKSETAGTTTWTKQVSGESDVDVTNVPFTLAWNTKGGTPKNNFDVTVAYNNDKIKATSTVDTSKSNTNNGITVNPIKVKTIEITGLDKTKVYDSTTTLTSPGFTYALKDSTILQADESTLAVAPTTVEYKSADVHTSQDLNISGWKLTNSVDGNYELDSTSNLVITGTPKGTITKRPITLNSIEYVPAVDQYSAAVATDGTATSNATGTNTKANIAASTGGDDGLVSGQNVTVSFNYQYDDTSTAGTNNIAVTVNGTPTVSDNNYDLQIAAGMAATGTVNSVDASAIAVQAQPTQFTSGAEYGDKLDYSGLIIKVEYGSPATATKYFKYTGTEWKECAADGTNETAPDSLPFAVTITDSKTQGSDLLSVGDVKVTATLSDDNTKTAEATLNVGKRKVTVTPSGTATKMYDGNDSYTGTGITYDVDYVSTPAATITKPTVDSATVTFDKKTVEATQVTVSSPVLSDTTNFVVNSIANGGVVTGATITARPIKLTAITNVPQVNQYATTGISGTGKTATSPTDAVFATSEDTVDGTTTYPIVSGDTVTVKYDYAYTDTATASPTDNVTLSNVALDTAEPNPNYELKDATNSKATKAPIVRTVDTVAVTNPTQLRSAATYKNQLDLSGMTVEVNYTSGDPDVYTATQSSGTVTWTKDSVTVTPPFTYQWTDTSKGANIAANEVLTVPAHNGNKITVSLTDGSGKTGVSASVTVNPKEITAITAELPSGEIAKVYDSKTELEAADKALIQYTFTGLDTSDTVTLTTTPSYHSKDVGNAIAIDFTAPSISGNTNYKLKDGVKVSSSLTGKITQKAVTITGVNVPITYKQASPTDDEEIAVSNAVLANDTVADKTVTATGFIDNEGQALKFDYTIVYPQSSLSAAGTPAVTIKNGEGTVSGTGSDNYSYTWPTGLKGNVLDDQFTDVAITQPTTMTGYTHGDVFNPSGMSVTIKTSSNTAGTTYTVISNGAGGYKWNTALPTGATVTVGTVSLTSDTDLNRNAHYTNMNGKKVTIKAGTESALSTDEVEVAQKQLSATASATGSVQKVYDKSTALPTGTTIGYTIGADEVQSFGGVTDKVSVTAKAAYENENVNATAGEDYKKLIKITNIDLAGADAGNYIKPTAIGDVEGKIKPFEIKVTDIAEAIPDAKLNDNSTKSGTIASTTSYTYDQTNGTQPDGTLPITFGYSYDNVASTGSHTVTIAANSIALATANTNYTVVNSEITKTGTVSAKEVQSIEITTQPTKDSSTYKYGDTLTLAGMKVKVTYSDNSEESDIDYDPTNENSVWSMLGLTIDGTSDGTPLKNSAHNGNKIYVKKGDVKSTNYVDLTVAKLKLNVTATPSATVTKPYDGTKTVNQTITLAIGAAGTSYDAPLTDDNIGINQTSYVYDSKNAAASITLKPSATTGLLTGNNTAEYEYTVPELTGEITKVNVTLTPNVGETIYANKFATAGYDVASTHASNSVTTSGFVTGEAAKYDLSYTLKLTADELKSAGTVSVPVQISGADNASYVKSVTAKDATNYPLTNYNFQWQDASVAITANAMTGIEVKTDPTDLANNKVYGDGIALDNMVVTATYTDGSKHDFTYSATTGSEWANEGFTVAIEDGGDLTKLVTDNSGKHIVVSKTGVGDASTNGTLTVNQKPLTLTATATKENLTREYNSLTSADETKITLGVDGSTPLVTGDSIDYGTFTADYYSGDNKDKNVADNKTVKVSNITPTIKNSDNVDVTNQYDITQPSTLTGEIKAKEIKVTGTGVPNILTGASELTKNVTTSYTDGAIYAGDDVTVPITAKYPDSLQDGTNRRTEKTVTFSIGTITGADKDNYSFTLDPSTGKGWVVDNLIDKIIVTAPSDTEYEHGDKLDLTGMVIAVKYQNAIDNNTYTYVSGNNWTDQSGTTVTTTDLPVSFVLVKDGAETAVASATKQLRRDDNGPTSKLVIKGDDITNEDNGGSPINITVGTKEITTVTPGYTPPTTAAPSKPYDGTTKVPDNSFVYYSDDILPDDKSEVEPLLGATAEYAQKDASYESNGTTLKDITINFSNPTLGTNDNYTLANNATIDTSGNLTGTISKAPLTITITSVPSITVGQNAEVNLTKGTHYTQTGEVTVDGVKETVDVAVKGTYTDNNTVSTYAEVKYTSSIADTTNNNNYAVTLKTADGDVIDNATVFGPEGTVNKKAVTGIAVTAPTTSTYEHGGSLALEGMTITVKYADDDSDNRTYKFTNGKWYETTSGADVELTGIPEDVTIKWNGTTTDVTDGAKLRLDDSDKGYVTAGDNKKATIKVAPSATGSLVEPATTDITIAKKQLTLTVSGNVSKKYDGTNTLSSLDGITATLDGVQGTTPDDVSVDTTKLLNNIRYDGTGTNKAGITTGSPKLVIGTIAITGGAAGYYKAPVVATDATNTVTNNTTGTIEKRPVKVIAITETMDAAIGASNGKLEGIGSGSYTLSSDNGLYQLVNGEDVKIDVDYAYGNTSTEGSTTVTYSNPKVSTSDNAYASNYAVSFAIDEGTAVISNGTVTGVTLSGPSQTGSYTHGDKFNLAGTEITITYNNDSTKTDKYSYDTESGKWTLTRNGGTPEATKVELPSELSLKLGSTTINTNPTSADDKTIVKYDNNTNTLVATYTKDENTVNSTPSAAYGVEQKKITINITPPTTDPIEQEYSGKNNKSLNDANLRKLSVEIPTNYAVPNETVSIKEGTFKAEFASGSVARDQNGDVIAQGINIDNDSFTLDGADKGNYKLIINNTATGKVTPKTATITANKVPPIKEGATNLVVDIADYTTDGFVEGDTPTITWKGTYNTSDPNASEIKVNTKTERTLDADTLNNYNVTWSPDSMTGTVTEKVVTEVKVITQPKFSTTEPKHGDKVGENGLDDLEYTVTYSDDSTTKHKKENGEWVTTDGYTAPEDGTTFKWNDTAEDVSKDSVIRKDKANTITIAVEGESAKTAAVTAAAKPVTVKAAGTYTKVYDGTNVITLNETTPEITYTIEGLVEGDVITVTATPEFADENVAKFGDDYVKAINFTNVTVNGDDDVLANYEIVKTDDVVTVDKTDLKGAITPKEMKITAITVPSKKKGAAMAVSVTNSKAFTTTDIVEKDKDSVTIKYEGAYTSTSAVGENIAVTITDGTLAIDGDDKAMMNYTPKLTGSAAGSVTTSGGGNGGGGGAPSNTLTIKDKTEDGKEGEIVKTLTAPAGSAPVDLIGVYKTAPKDPTIIWKSADEKIATVDENGVVSFISEGKTTITATSKTNSSLTAKVEVTVTAPLATPEPTTTPGTVNTPEPTKEPSVITKNMMNPYIVGYDDNVFGPELPISREEVATIFARLIANSIDMDKSYTSQFWDVTENEWSKDYIGYLETFDILHGYDDGSFMPKAYITRAEMAVMMARAEGYDIEGYMDVSELSFPDIPEDYGIWATKAIKYLTDAGVMEGYEDGTFRPTQPITRAETVATVNRVLSDMVVDKIEVLPSDVTDAHWAYDNIVFAMNHRVLKDAAADPNKFVWSEEFDQNIVVKQETVDGDLTDTADGENNSPSESDASAEQTDAPETTASPDAAPEATEMPKEETEPSVSPEPDKEN